MTANTPTPDSVALIVAEMRGRAAYAQFDVPRTRIEDWADRLASLPTPGVPVERVLALSAEWREDAARLRRLAGKAQQRGDLGDADFRSMAAQDADGYADQLDALAQEGT